MSCAAADDLSCPVCYSEYDMTTRQPKALPCHHTFCEECLNNPFLRPGGRILCPFCRTPSESSGTVNARILDLLQEAGGVDRECQRQSGPHLPPEICPLCEVYFEGSAPMPRMLECAHVFCGECVLDMLATYPGHVVKFLYCPLCVAFVQDREPFTYSGLAPAPYCYGGQTLPKQTLDSEEDRRQVHSVPSGEAVAVSPDEEEEQHEDEEERERMGGCWDVRALCLLF